MSQKSSLPKKLKFPGFLRKCLRCCVLCRRRNHGEGAAIPNLHAIDGYSGGAQPSKGQGLKRRSAETPVGSDSSNFDEKSEGKNKSNFNSSSSSFVFSVDSVEQMTQQMAQHHVTNQQVTNQQQVNLSRPNTRRTAVVSTLPESDLSVLSDRIATLQRNQPMVTNIDMKRSKWSLGKLGFKNNKNDAKLMVAMSEIKCKEEVENNDERIRNLIQFKYETSVKQVSNSQNENYVRSNREVNYYEALKELFTTERSFLVNSMLVLLEVFLEPLQQLQCEGHLLHIDARSVFGNIEQLCSVTLQFCETLLEVVKKSSRNEYSEGLMSAFETFESSICPPYQRYFAGYDNSVAYTEELKNDNDFNIFLQWCEQNTRCHRLKLNDFLVSPMQHLTKYPLLLRHIIEYTDDIQQADKLQRTVEVVEESLKSLEGKVSCLARYQFLQDLQRSISWPPVYDIEPKTFLPEALKNVLKHQPSCNLLASTKRHIEKEGTLNVIENGKTIELYVILFDEFILLTKQRKRKRRPNEIPSSLKRHAYLKDGTLLSVYRQPIALDRLMVYDLCTQEQASVNQRRSLAIVHENRFQQMIGAVVLESASEEEKKSWLKAITTTASRWMRDHVCRFPQEEPCSPVTKKCSNMGESPNCSVFNRAVRDDPPETPGCKTPANESFLRHNNDNCVRHSNTNESCIRHNNDGCLRHSIRRSSSSNEFEYFAALNNRFSVSSDGNK